MESVSCADGDIVATTAGPQRLRELWFLLGFWLRSGREEQFAGSRHSRRRKTGRCEIRPDSYVHRIETDARGRVIGAAYFDKDENTHLQKAKAVIVCANGAETPRLLLMSANAHFQMALRIIRAAWSARI